MTPKLIAIAVLLLGACSEPVLGPPTQTVCPPGGTTVTWENFTRKFMFDYCTRCHHQDLVGDDRQGAPLFHDFDTVFGTCAVRAHVDETTASGPNGTNDSMPPDGTKPTLEERKKLAEWIACPIAECPEP